MANESPSFYAIIPANVRYDKRLCANAKLLYGEITALCNAKGFCWAGNSYFASLYDVSNVSISKWVKQLVDACYLKTQLFYKEGTKEILHRSLTIVYDPTQEKFSTPPNESLAPYPRKVYDPTQEKFKDNNTFNITDNTTLNNTYSAANAAHEKKFNATDFLEKNGVEEKTIGEWLQVRKAKKTVNTQTALESILKNVQAAGLTANQGIEICVKNSWAGFKGAWLENQVKSKKAAMFENPRGFEAHQAAALRDFERYSSGSQSQNIKQLESV